MVLETREMLCELFHFNRPQNVIFTMNITQSLNFLKKGFGGPGDHVLVSAMGHNAVMRPLTQLAAVSYTHLDVYKRQGLFQPASLDDCFCQLFIGSLCLTTLSR